MKISYLTSHKGKWTDLKRCVQSVYLDLSSSGFDSYEHLIYLDGVEDFKDYYFLKDYQHIKLYKSQISLGKAKRVNELLENAKGEIIYFMDSDDLTLRERTEEQYHHLKRSDSLISGTNFYFWQKEHTFA